jgi:hypothetical protein
MSHATAYQLLMRKRPELFTDKSGRGPITASMKIFASRNDQHKRAYRESRYE